MKKILTLALFLTFLRKGIGKKKVVADADDFCGSLKFDEIKVN